MHQLVHVADGLKWLGPMHVYSQWGMERMCGMITRTAKSRVNPNRNMELTLLLTEQKHLLGYVMNETDWPTTTGSSANNSNNLELEDDNSEEELQASGDPEENIEDGDGNLSLARAFAHRIQASRPEPVRDSTRMPGEQFQFLGRVQTRGPRDVERRRIREFMSGLANYNKDQMSCPTHITVWRWCKYRDQQDNKKQDFKVTSRQHKQANNSPNSSLVSYKDSQGQRAYAEVQFFFHTYLPAELGDASQRLLLQTRPRDSDLESDEDATGTSLYRLAFVRKIMVECEDRLVRRVNQTGALAVIAASAIESLVGCLKVQKEEYLTTRFTSMLRGTEEFENWTG